MIHRGEQQSIGWMESVANAEVGRAVDNQWVKEKTRVIVISIMSLTSDLRASEYENDLLGLRIVINKEPRL